MTFELIKNRRISQLNLSFINSWSEAKKKITLEFSQRCFCLEEIWRTLRKARRVFSIPLKAIERFDETPKINLCCYEESGPYKNTHLLSEIMSFFVLFRYKD